MLGGGSAVDATPKGLEVLSGESPHEDPSGLGDDGGASSLGFDGMIPFPLPALLIGASKFTFMLNLCSSSLSLNMSWASLRLDSSFSFCNMWIWCCRDISVSVFFSNCILRSLMMACC